jgi:hypothetical protein
MAHNVPAVYDVFASPNKGFAKQRPGLQKCGWSEPWEAQPTWANGTPERPTGAEHIQSCYAKFLPLFVGIFPVFNIDYENDIFLFIDFIK